MSSRLTRRALFALPVALPVAAAAAKAGVVAKVRSLWDGVLSPSAMRRVENLKPLPFTFETKMEPPFSSSPAYRLVRQVDLPWHDFGVGTLGPAKFSDDELAATLGVDAGVDAGGNDDKVAVAVAQPVVA